ncbi:dinB family protein [Collimonas fungivorans]|uniref:DinB family protein n=1 Tax=Collimonas fungivorans TaxID=158899 RepID=A0A127PJD8_9BURK|nr:DinB family protein [Collimonas fungivorans]AMO97744.1 dinB family protein [Collimonas fungivorans]
MMQQYFATLARYHVWATDQLLAHIKAVNEAEYRQDRGLYFGSVHGTLNHMLVGERHWYARIADGVSLKMALDVELESERDALAAALREAAGRWEKWLTDHPVQTFDRDLHYNRASGVAAVAPFAPVLGHVFNHGTHHRGQLTAALTGMGHACPELDLIYWTVAMRQAETNK